MHPPVSSLPQSSLKFFSPFAILFSCAALRLTKDGRDRLDLPCLTLDSFRAFAFNGHKRDLTWRSLCNHTIAFMAVAANVYHGTYARIITRTGSLMRTWEIIGSLMARGTPPKSPSCNLEMSILRVLPLKASRYQTREVPSQSSRPEASYFPSKANAKP